MKSTKVQTLGAIRIQLHHQFFEQVWQHNFTSIIGLRRSTQPHRSSKVRHRSSILESRHIALRRSTHRSSIFEGRHIDLRPSTIDHRPSIIDHRSSIFDHRPSIIDLRPSTIDLRPSIFASTFDHRHSIFDHRSSHRSSTIDLRTSIFEHRSSKIEGGNIAPTIQHRTDNSSPNIVHNGAP